MCNCIETIKKQSLATMQAEHGFTEVVETPFFKNHSIYPEVTPYFPIEGKYMQGKKKRVFKVNLYPTFCPFCGVKYKSEKQ